MSGNKEIAEAEALVSLESNEGWKIVKAILEAQRKTSLEKLANNKETPNMEKVIWYQTMYQQANNVLVLIDNKIKRGVEAKKKSDG